MSKGRKIFSLVIPPHPWSVGGRTYGRFADVVCESARRAGSDRLVLHASRSVDDLASRIGTLLKPTDTVLLKGSRALRLERLIEHIAGH